MTMADDVPGLFITGTDTEVGKTYVAALIARSLAASGRRVCFATRLYYIPEWYITQVHVFLRIDIADLFRLVAFIFNIQGIDTLG